MLAAVADSPGAAGTTVHIRNVDEPQGLGAGEVAVRMLATTVNPSDLVTISGAYGSRTAFPLVPGFEGIGVITRIGPGVPREAVGQRVLPIGSAGNWQQIKRTDYAWCVPVPDDVPDELACFAYINPLTASKMVERFIAAETATVVITAATSAIAGHLAELLNLNGIKPIGLTRGTPGRTVDNPSLWRDIVTTGDREWPDRLAHLTGGQGADVAFDSVGGPGALDLMRALRPGGTLVHYGLLSGLPLPAECFSDHREKKIEMFRLRDLIHQTPRNQLGRLFQPVFAHLRAERLRTTVSDRRSFAALPEALTTDPTKLGKPLITFPE